MVIKKIIFLLISAISVFVSAFSISVFCDEKIDLYKIEKGNYSPLNKCNFDKINFIAYNIKFGSNLDGIIQYLKSKIREDSATIIAISEADRNHSRSKDKEVAKEIATQLKLNYIYGIEFIEYDDETRDKQGMSGNALFSNCPIENETIIRHTDVFDWTKKSAWKDSIRGGSRSALIGDVKISENEIIKSVSLHLENRSNSEGRNLQLNEIFEKLEEYSHMPIIIGGDFNETYGSILFKNVEERGYQNAFKGDNTKTGGCLLIKELNEFKCFLKIDWILYKNLKLESSKVESSVNEKGEIISDHAPIIANFSILN